MMNQKTVPQFHVLLVSRDGNGILHIGKVITRQARLILN